MDLENRIPVRNGKGMSAPRDDRGGAWRSSRVFATSVILCVAILAIEMLREPSWRIMTDSRNLVRPRVHDFSQRLSISYRKFAKR